MRKALLLVITGIACLACGTATWGQGADYQCGSYSRVCGLYDCYPISGHCSGVVVQWLDEDDKMGGGCLYSPGHSCNTQSYNCQDKMIRGTSCGGVVQCVVSMTVQLCP